MLKIYVANLNKYNNGKPSGVWISLPTTTIKLQAALQAVAANEEYIILDYETNFRNLEIYEYENLNRLNVLARRLKAVKRKKGFEDTLVLNKGNLQKALDVYEGVLK